MSPVQTSARSQVSQETGLKLGRFYTRAGVDPLTAVKLESRRSVITNPDGSVVFEMDEVEVPETWSQLATDIMVGRSTSARRGFQGPRVTRSPRQASRADGSAKAIRQRGRAAWEATSPRPSRRAGLRR